MVGRVAKPHGVHGDLLVDIITDFPERLDDGVRIGVGDDDAQLEFYEIHRVRYHKGRWLLSLKGIRDRAAVEDFRGRYLFLPEQSLDQLPDGYYYEHHLVGLECRGTDGTVHGEVVGLDPGVGQSRLLVRRGRGEYLVHAGGCISCHTDTDNDGPPLAGGRALETPFGTFYSPNITPDPEHGIGAWSADQFVAALREGVGPGGEHYYPIFPYTAYAKMRREDALAIWAYLQTVEPVAAAFHEYADRLVATLRADLVRADADLTRCIICAHISRLPPDV